MTGSADAANSWRTVQGVPISGFGEHLTSKQRQPKMMNSLTKRLARSSLDRKLRTGPAIVQIDFLGCQMLIRSKEDVGRSMALKEFETEDLQHFIGAIRDRDLVFDIGANVGAYCVPIARTFPEAKIYAFEPIELNAALIQVSLLVNRLRGVQVVRQCVSNESGVVEFSLAEDSAYSSMVDTGRKSEVEKFQCTAISVDDFCVQEQCGTPDILKIDVEGAELKVLQGATRLFSYADKRPRLVLMELYDQNLNVFGVSIADVTTMMSGWGYRPYVLIDGVRVPFIAQHYNLHYNVFFEA